jgi:hypothetical protein
LVKSRAVFSSRLAMLQVHKARQHRLRDLSIPLNFCKLALSRVYFCIEIISALLRCEKNIVAQSWGVFAPTRFTYALKPNKLWQKTRMKKLMCCFITIEYGHKIDIDPLAMV